MNCRDIIEQHLKENGYDGLCCGDCSCRVGDLFPCGDNVLCHPGHLRAMTEKEAEEAYVAPGGEDAWVIYRRIP